MVMSLPLTGFVVVIWMAKWLWKWLPSLVPAVSSKVPDGEVTHLAPYPCEPIRGREKFSLTMGLRRLNATNWLTVDRGYVDEHWVRDRLLREDRHRVLQCLPEAQEACEEMLDEVINFLCEHFPRMFEKRRHGCTTTIRNQETGEAFQFGDLDDKMGPLEIAARLAMEDLSILMKNENDEYYLAASATLFPVGWTINERIGWTISDLHQPVPQWREKVGHSVNKFMSRLAPNSPMERSNYFLQTRRPDEDLFSVLFQPAGLSQENLNPSPRDVILRRERQTFRRLPRTQAIVFSVKTTLTMLDELPPQELMNLATEINHWPEDIAAYKGRHIWGATVLGYCKERIGSHVVEE